MSGKKLKFNIPKYDGPEVLRWVRQVYDIMKEASPTLLESKEICDAYNGLVDCVIKYDGKYFTIKKSKHNRKSVIIDNYENIDLYVGINSEDHFNLRRNIDNVKKDIFEYYTKLFDLIKSDVLPFIEKKEIALQMEYYTRKIKKLEKDKQELITKLDKKIQELTINQGEYYENLMKLQKQFDEL